MRAASAKPMLEEGEPGANEAEGIQECTVEEPDTQTAQEDTSGRTVSQERSPAEDSKDYERKVVVMQSQARGYLARKKVAEIKRD